MRESNGSPFDWDLDDDEWEEDPQSDEHPRVPEDVDADDYIESDSERMDRLQRIWVERK